MVALGAMLAALARPVATAGQSALPPVRLIPIDGEGFELRLSPERTTAAVFDQAILLNNEVDPSRLPIRLVDLASGRQIGTLDGFTDYAADVAFAPDGSSLASLHWNGDLYRWDLSGTEPEPGAPIQSGGMAGGRISYLPDSHTVLARVGYSPQRFYQYDLDTGAIPHIIGVRAETWNGFRQEYLEGPPFDVTYPAFAVSPDGSRLATSTSSDEVALWSIPDGQPVILRPRSEQAGRMSIRQLGFTPDGSTLVYFDRSDGRTHLWDVDGRVELRSLPFGGSPFALSLDGTTLAWAENGATDEVTILRVADLSNPFESPRDLVAVRMRRTPFSSLDFSPDGSSLVVGGLVAPDEEQAIVIVPVN
jgi:WD40 repeat protein